MNMQLAMSNNALKLIYNASNTIPYLLKHLKCFLTRVKSSGNN